MLNFLFNKKKFTKSLAHDVVNETETLMNKMHSRQLDQFDDIKQILNHLTQKITNIENQIATKPL